MARHPDRAGHHRLDLFAPTGRMWTCTWGTDWPTHVCIYIYIYRERERDIDIFLV